MAAGTGRIGHTPPVSLPPGEVPLQLRPGTVVRAMVADVQGDMAVLRILGTAVRALVRVPMFPGELVDLMVTAVESGQVYLRRLDRHDTGVVLDLSGGGNPAAGQAPAAAGTGSPVAARWAAGPHHTGPTAPAHPGGAATPAGMPAGTPPAPEAATPAGATPAPAAAGPGGPPSPLRTPGTPTAAAGAGGGLSPEELAARALAAYRQPLSPDLISRLGRILAATPASVRIQAAAAAAWLVASGQPPTPGAVRALVAAGSGPRPWSLSQRLENLARALDSAAGALTEHGRTEAAAALRSRAQALRQWGWHPDAPPPEPLPQLLAETRHLVRTLPPAASPAPRAALRELEEFADALRRLAGNPQSAPPDGPEAPWLVYPVPLRQPSLGEEAVILWRRPAGRRRRAREEGDELRLFLHPPHLGDVAVHLLWRNRTLRVTVVAADRDATAALQAALPDLESALRRRGLEVAGLCARTGAPEQPPVLPLPEAAPPRGLDRKV